MTIYRGASSGDAVVVILRAAAQDNRISLRALGILTNVLSRPDDWRTTGAHLAEQRPEGRDAVLKALSELERYGYLQRVTRRLANGQLVKVWEITDDPTLLRRRHRTDNGLPGVGKPGTGKPGRGRPGTGQPGTGKPGRGRPGTGQPGVASPGDGSPAHGRSGEVLEEETQGETPPPTPAVDDPAPEHVDELERVVVGVLRKTKTPIPGRPQLRKQCARLAQLQWRPVQLHACMEGHDWTGARAGAVITWLRQLQAPSATPDAAQDRPAWCGACDEATRLLTDPEGRAPRRCPACHPLSTRKDPA